MENSLAGQSFQEIPSKGHSWIWIVQNLPQLPRDRASWTGSSLQSAKKQSTFAFRIALPFLVLFPYLPTYTVDSPSTGPVGRQYRKKSAGSEAVNSKDANQSFWSAKRCISHFFGVEFLHVHMCTPFKFLSQKGKVKFLSVSLNKHIRFNEILTPTISWLLKKMSLNR